jgi:hypothetical protein
MKQGRAPTAASVIAPRDPVVRDGFAAASCITFLWFQMPAPRIGAIHATTKDDGHGSEHSGTKKHPAQERRGVLLG